MSRDIQLLADLAVAVRTASSIQDIHAHLARAVQQAVGDGTVGLAARDLPDGALALLGALLPQLESALGRRLGATCPSAVREALTAGRLTALPQGVASLVDDPEAQAWLRSRGVDAVHVLGSGSLALGVAARGEVPAELVEAMVRITGASLDAFAGDEGLRESEQRFRFLMANTTDSLVILDREGNQRYVSPAAERITGFPVEELQGRALPEIIHSEDMPAVLAAWNEVLAHPEKPCRVQYRHRHKTREWVYSEASAQAFFDEPTIRGVVATVRDVSERIQAEEELRQSEARFRTLAEHLPGVVYLCRKDARYSVLYVGPEIERLTGFPLADFMEGRLGMFDIIHPDDAPGVVAAVDKALSQKRAYNLTYRVGRRDGTWRWVEERGLGVPDREGVLLQGFMADITERKEAEAERERLTAQLNQAQKMESIGRLAGGVAHDFNNMLGAILGNTELAMEQVPPTSAVAADLGEIRKAAERSADLTRQLLAFARKANVRSVPVDIHATLCDVSAMLGRTIDPRIAIRLRLGAPRATVIGDPAQLQSAFLNLALNARDAMPDGGTLTFETSEAPNERLQIRVTDTGIGMGDEVRRRIFQPFFTTKDPGRGTGLGLSAVYGTVTHHGGEIQVESEPGTGSRFTMLLPLARDAALPEPPAASEPAQPKQAHVLVADDEPAVLQVTALMLSALGYLVTQCADGRAAVNCYRTAWRTIDLVLLDVMMPSLGGAGALIEMRQMNPQVRAILFSGHPLGAAEHALVDQGAAAFLPKPFTRADLARVVASAIAG